MISCPNPECPGALRLVYSRKEIGDMRRALRMPFKQGMEALKKIRPKVYYIDLEKLKEEVKP